MTAKKQSIKKKNEIEEKTENNKKINNENPIKIAFQVISIIFLIIFSIIFIEGIITFFLNKGGNELFAFSVLFFSFFCIINGCNYYNLFHRSNIGLSIFLIFVWVMVSICLFFYILQNILSTILYFIFVVFGIINYRIIKNLELQKGLSGSINEFKVIIIPKIIELSYTKEKAQKKIDKKELNVIKTFGLPFLDTFMIVGMIFYILSFIYIIIDEINKVEVSLDLITIFTFKQGFMNAVFGFFLLFLSQWTKYKYFDFFEHYQKNQTSSISLYISEMISYCFLGLIAYKGISIAMLYPARNPANYLAGDLFFLLVMFIFFILLWIYITKNIQYAEKNGISHYLFLLKGLSKLKHLKDKRKKDDKSKK